MVLGDLMKGLSFPFPFLHAFGLFGTLALKRGAMPGAKSLVDLFMCPRKIQQTAARKRQGQAHTHNILSVGGRAKNNRLWMRRAGKSCAFLSLSISRSL